MQMKQVKPKKTYDEYLRDLQAGKAVKATDLCASMGIKTFTIK